MAKYYALIRRADFIDLFKYGRLFLNPVMAVPVQEGVQTPSIDVVGKLFEKANFFESSFTYLIIKYESAEYSYDNPAVNIEDVTNVYPLDYEAKKEFESSFDAHIRVENPIWADAYTEIQKLRTRRDCEKGAINLWQLYKPVARISDCREIITDSILNEVVEELYDNRRPQGDLPIWVYLLRYERHAFYPQGNVGYVFDVVNVVINQNSQKEIVDSLVVENTNVGKLLSTMPDKASFSDIVQKLKNSEVSKAFMSAVCKKENRVDFIYVAAAFLYLKNKYKDTFSYKPEVIDSLSQKTTPIEVSLIIYLLGITLGHDRTYECLYEALPLPIYKSQDEMTRLRERQADERRKAASEMMDVEKSSHRRSRHTHWDQSNKGGYSSERYTRYNGYGGGQKPATFPGQNHNEVKKAVEQKSETKTTGPDNIATNISGNAQRQSQLPSQPPVEVQVIGKSWEKENTHEVSIGEGRLFPYNESADVPKFPCVMGKLKKGSSREFCKTPKPIEIYTEEEYQNLYNKGWREVKGTDSKDEGQFGS